MAVLDTSWASARALTAALRSGELAASALMAATYDRIERLNPHLNAIVNLLPRDQAMALAREADEQLARGVAPGPLHGLPMAGKDLADVRGFPTTFGFRPFANRQARRDSPHIARCRQAGALYIGKTNTAEFGLGSHTFNALFGSTRNPHDLARSAGGSSGGAASALAAGLLALADGSDMGGSLRNPAGFCGVVGLRPSVGVVPGDVEMGWLARLSTNGPMARSVDDLCLLLSVQAGPWAADPLSLPLPADGFENITAHPAPRLCYGGDLGFLPLEPAVRTVCETAVERLRASGIEVTGDRPRLDDAMAVFETQRALTLRVLGRNLDLTVPRWREQAKDSMLWNVERGLALELDDVVNAERRRTALHQRMVRFFEGDGTGYDALLLPTAQVLPFPVELDWPREIDGQPMNSYLDWMTVCCVVTATGAPALSIPCGVSADGLPVGLQVIGRPGQDRELLAVGLHLEAVLDASGRPSLD